MSARPENPIPIDGRSLSLDHFGAVVSGGAKCRLSPEAIACIEASRGEVERALAGGEAIYGVTTGFGDLARVRIDADHIEQLQERLILSHCAGVGERLPAPVIRGMLLLRANTLARGNSGVRVELIQYLLALLDADLLPVIPSRGSVGASGDLAPLAHLALPLIGRGQVCRDGREMPSREALAAIGLKPLTLQAKEGLALINGTQATTALLALAVLGARDLVKIADLVAALSTEALRGTDTAFDPRLHALRPHPGQQVSAANLWRLMQGSSIRESHRAGDVRIQDPYSVRCAPQVHGAVRDVLADVCAKVAVELNSVTDNPLVFPDDGAVLSGGNFHGEPMALAADFLAIALAELGAISERRLEKLTNTAFSGLPAFLVSDAGLNSGFMMAQVTSAALASENKTLCHPAAVDSIPTSADKEDHVSMGMWAALKLQKVLENSRRILAIELLAAAQGIDLLRPLRSSDELEAVHRAFRQWVRYWGDDREMAPDIDAAHDFLRELAPFLDRLD